MPGPEGVNGGSAFGICTVAASCLMGSTGDKGGELNGPVAVAADAAGNVYVAEFSSNRVSKFSSSGSFERAWGGNVVMGPPSGPEICTVAASCQAGSPGPQGGELTNPRGIATDGAGNVYVAEDGNNRISKFDSSGNFERAWGKGVNSSPPLGVCTVAANCLMGTSGSLGGEFSPPLGVGADSSGNVYVVETGNNRISKFDSSGNFERAWGKGVNSSPPLGVCTVAANCLMGSTGSLGGEFNAPGGVATDSAGNVYVGDTSNNRVQKFDSAGTFERMWGKGVNMTTPSPGNLCTAASGDTCKAGTSGELGGEFFDSRGVATDSAGNVYVDDEVNQRIQKFDSAGTFQRAWGKNVAGGGVFGICTVAASCLAGSNGSLGGELDAPRGVASDPSGSVYVAKAGNQRIQRFADPAPPPPPPPPPAAGGSPTATGQRAAALKKCKKKKSKKARKKCKRKANKLPV